MLHDRIFCRCTDDGEDSEQSSVDYRVIARSHFTEGDADVSLTKLNAGPVAGLDSVSCAIRAAACILREGKLMGKATAAEVASASDDSDAPSSSSSAVVPGAPGTYDVSVKALGEFMRLDNAAIRALNLLPSKRDAVAVPIPTGGGSSSSNASLYSSNITSVFSLLASKAKTQAGKRLLKSWLLQPLTDRDAIIARQEVVQAFVDSSWLRSEWGKDVALEDVAGLVGRLQRDKAGLSDLVKLKQVTNLLPSLMELLDPSDGGKYDGPDAGKAALAPFHRKLAQTRINFSPFISAYDAAVDDRDVRRPRLRPEVDPSLSELASDVSEAMDALDAYVEECRGEWPDDIDLKCEYDRAKGGWIFRGKKKGEKSIRDISGVLITAVLKDGIYFTTKGSRGLQGLAEALEEAEAAYADRSKHLIAPLLSSAVSSIPALELLQSHVAELDCYYALGEVAANGVGTWVRPTIAGRAPSSSSSSSSAAAGSNCGTGAGAGSSNSSNSSSSSSAASDANSEDDTIGDILVVGGRHPVVEVQATMSQGGFIPNDYTLRRQRGRFQIITGACTTGIYIII